MCSSASVLPTASGLDSGSKSANRLNQADRSVELVPEASEIRTQSTNQAFREKEEASFSVGLVFSPFIGALVGF